MRAHSLTHTHAHARAHARKRSHSLWTVLYTYAAHMRARTNTQSLNCLAHPQLLQQGVSPRDLSGRPKGERFLTCISVPAAYVESMSRSHCSPQMWCRTVDLDSFKRRGEKGRHVVACRYDAGATGLQVRDFSRLSS